MSIFDNLLCSLILLVFCIKIQAYNFQCPVYSCTNKTVKSLQTPCATFSANTFSISYCPSQHQNSSYCPIQNLKPSVPNVYCEAPPSSTKKPPGYFVSDANECLSGVVGYYGENLYCIGKVQGQSCKANQDCDFQSYCHNGICTSLKTEGQQCNQSDTPCMSYLVCDMEVCVYPGSKSIGQESYNKLACQSNYLQSKEVDSQIKSFCGEGYSLLQKDYQNNGSFECIYQIQDANNFTLSPKCLYSQENQHYCTPGSIDTLPQFQILVEYLENEPACPYIPGEFNGLPSYFCDRGIEIDEELYSEAIQAYYKIHFPNQIEKTSDCMKSVNPKYWMYADAKLISIPSLSLLTLILTFFYLLL